MTYTGWRDGTDELSGINEISGETEGGTNHTNGPPPLLFGVRHADARTHTHSGLFITFILYERM